MGANLLCENTSLLSLLWKLSILRRIPGEIVIYTHYSLSPLSMLKQGPAECGSGVNSGESTPGILLNHLFFQTIFPIRTLQILKWSLLSRVPHISKFFLYLTVLDWNCVRAHTDRLRLVLESTWRLNDDSMQALHPFMICVVRCKAAGAWHTVSEWCGQVDLLVLNTRDPGHVSLGTL